MSDLIFQFPQCWILSQAFSSAAASVIALAEVLVRKSFLVTDSLVHVNCQDWQVHKKPVEVEKYYEFHRKIFL